ncbi:DUF1501 domain-containing protein [Undibacterium sp. RTI2.1]|uniref:DUF1501 domain-containing protein n=1 Tax=unclassified Undibacterium TaxID=2630295 RepID=UPI002AB5BD64|nr:MULTISPECIES: DUF1501 domain-containing protein [unclassified Undibacterium]MDY7537370.1 DUF1501 domain-containing protein [Undibacterium sp. 5I1]MEB0031243.1 DUF1501 domain-containing protein [Undibacterium sp. RTI2.1]MEB0117623.1 DUF1501 domain-containing protein [Undibacterium sp. RTI2.2]MEB0232031.1 DUF1501 domain-containing protein [Undibacterium sp. 10I3]MEB0259300.1 DUF1501 domain-containing protein [Undibacterium sp. 5I1]
MLRRHVLKTLALSSGIMLPLSRSAFALQSSDGDVAQKKLIVIMLRGAVDGLNVVAPVGDANYRRLRPSIGLAKPGTEFGAINLDGYFGLNPALADLTDLWNEKKLAFVHSSGSPDTTRSHFDAQDYLETGTPGRKSTQDGWMNRLLSTLPGDKYPTRSLAIGPVMPRILSGNAVVTNIANGAAGSKATLLDNPAIGNAFDKMYQGKAAYSQQYQDAKSAHKDIMTASMEKMDHMDKVEMAASNGAPLPNGFPRDASRLATLMKNDPKIQMAFFALGGWDTHVNQGSDKGKLANLLSPLGKGLATLSKQLGPLFDDTTIVVMSEFGRTAHENGTGGTDHGHGNVMWVLGGKVAGGKVHGRWSGLDENSLYEGRDLAITTDFRSVLSQVAERHLQLSDKQLATVFPLMPRADAGLALFTS